MSESFLQIKGYIKKPARPFRYIVFAVLLCVFCGIILKRAWVSDDSYITFRVVDNFLNGYGLRWNINERVQVYTHPLWMMIISAIAFITDEVYLTSIFFSVILSVGVCILFCYLEKENNATWLGIVMLAFSSAYVDYSTSGLENPLSHFLIMLFLVVYLRSKEPHTKNKNSLFWLSLIAAFGGLNRLDMLLLYFPAIALVFIQHPSKKTAILQIVSGLFPLIVWLIFSTIYYGFPFPNTFYAKLNHWLSKEELINQGILYITHTVFNDPVTALVIVAGFVLAFINRSVERWAFSVSGILYLCYVIWVGGDFMEGRFLTTVFLLSSVLIVHYDLAKVKKHHYIWLFIVLFVLNLQSSIPTVAPLIWEFEESWEDGIVNERYFYADHTGLFRNGHFNTEPDFPWVYDGKSLEENCRLHDECISSMFSVGFAGYYAGPDVYIVDQLGLGSALISRIPPKYNPNWRIGHLERVIPEGFLQYLETGNINLVENVSLRIYIEAIESITQDEVFSRDRLNTLIRFWKGDYDEYILEEDYMYP